MTIKSVFFDLDDTLHDHQKPFRDAITRSFPEVFDDRTIMSIYKKFRECSDDLWTAYVTNEIALDEMRIQRISQTMKFFDMILTREQAETFQLIYESCLSNLELFPMVNELLGALQEKGLQVGIITNGPAEHQRNKIKALGLTNYISEEHIFISGELGIAKPDPRIFQLAAEKTGHSPSELLYVGDSWDNDVIGAYQAGWDAVWFNHRKRQPGSEQIQRLAEIDHLMELIENNELKGVTKIFKGDLYNEI